MEITVKIPFQYITKQRLDVNEEEFKNKIVQFVDSLENDFYLNVSLYKELLSYGIDQKLFDKMVEEVETFASYDENHEEIGFPYESWIERLLEVYSDSRQENVKKT